MMRSDKLGPNAFQQELAQLGWTGLKVAVEVRWADGHDERYAEIVAEFVRLKVDVIVTNTTPATLAAMKATSTIPIVFVAVASTGLSGGLHSHWGGRLDFSDAQRD